MKRFWKSENTSVAESEKFEAVEEKRIFTDYDSMVGDHHVEDSNKKSEFIDTIGPNWTRNSLYHGSVLHVPWGQPIADEHIPEVDAAVGITQQEALSALVSSEIAEDNSLTEEARQNFEKYFAGFTHDLLGELDKPDGEYKFEQSLHKRSFHSVDSGLLFDYVKPEEGPNQERKIIPKKKKKGKADTKSLFSKKSNNQSLEEENLILAQSSDMPRIQVPQFQTENDAEKPKKQSLPDEDLPVRKVTAYAASPYFENHDPVLLISSERVSSRPAEEGHYDPDGLTKVRTFPELKRSLGLSSRFPTLIRTSGYKWLPKEIDCLLSESISFSQWIRSSRMDLESWYKGRNPYISAISHDLFSHLCAHKWKQQPWMPLLLDIEYNYHSEERFWKLGQIDFERTNPSQSIESTSSEPELIRARIPLSNSAGKILASQITRFLEKEDELDAISKGVLSEEEEEMFIKLRDEFSLRDLMTATLDGLDDYINDVNVNNAIKSGLIEITRLCIVDAFGQVMEINPTGLFTTNPGDDPKVSVGLSLQNENDEYGKLVLRPRIPKPARLDFKFLSHQNDTQPSTSESKAVFGGSNTSSPVCGYLLPDHIEWAMEVFDKNGDGCGQLRVAERNWSLGGIQKGRLTWDSNPGDVSPAGGLPETGNIHMDRLLNSLMEIGLIDDQEKESPNGGEGVLSALLRAIDSTYWHSDPFGKGGGNHPGLYMGRPVAVVRAALRLQIEGGQSMMSEELKNHLFEVRLGSVEREIDGLLGYFVNDDYTRFNAVYPLDESRSPIVPETGSIDHGFLKFDPTIDVYPEQDVYLTLLINPQAAMHITSGVLPQVEVSLLREHWEDSLAKIAPTFRVGPVLVDPTSIRMPIDDGKPNVAWSWMHRETPTEWQSSEIKRSDSLAGLPNGKMRAYEGWLKLQREDD